RPGRWTSRSPPGCRASWRRSRASRTRRRRACSRTPSTCRTSRAPSSPAWRRTRRSGTIPVKKGADPMNQKKDVLQVGIDLGTSRSSISASNGAREVVESYVGWPVDMVAKKVVKKPILFGREALDNRPMLDLHRPLERALIKQGSQKDEDAVRALLQHLIG